MQLGGTEHIRMLGPLSWQSGPRLLGLGIVLTQKQGREERNWWLLGTCHSAHLSAA